MASPQTADAPVPSPAPPRFPWVTFSLGILLLTLAIGLWLWQAVSRPATVLIIGVDRDGYRADVVIAAHWDARSGLLSLLSLPRDLRTPIPCGTIPGCKSPDKLAHAHAYGTLPGAPGGAELTLRAAEALLAVPVRQYVHFDFQAFAKAVDALGGVTIQVDAPMDYEDPYQDLKIHIKPGRQKMDGETALKYVRFREDGRGDVGRIERTQKFFHALLESARNSGALSRLPGLIRDVWPYVKTNVDLATAVKLAQTGMNMQPGRLRTATVPGEPKWLDDLWFWEPDQGKLRELVAEYLGGRGGGRP